MTDTDKKADLQQELGALKKDVENLRVHTAEVASKIKDVGKEKVESTFKSTKKAVKEAEKTLEKNPVATVAGAVGIGAILGSIARRLLSSDKKKKK